MNAGKQTRPPRGALAVVAVGLIATLAAALLSTDEATGSAAELFWEAKAPLPDSKTAPIPGGGAMQISEAGVRVTEPHISGYSTYRVARVLRNEAGLATR